MFWSPEVSWARIADGESWYHLELIFRATVIRFDSLKSHEGCVTQGLIANKALILLGRLMSKLKNKKKTLFLKAPLVAIGAQKIILSKTNLIGFLKNNNYNFFLMGFLTIVKVDIDFIEALRQ